METKGTIGIFDSGLGGLLVLSRMRALAPEYNYVFFGDQAYVPYGNKTKEELLARAKIVFDYLFKEHKCTVILLACNTTSTNIYPELREWVDTEHPGKQVWGIVRPTIEAIKNPNSVVFFGTHRTISSHEYKNAILQKGAQNAVEIEMPELATMIENGTPAYEYIKSFNTLNDESSYTGVLVCTHYGIAIEDFKKAFPQIGEWICQEDIISSFFKTHMDTKKEFAEKIGTDNSIEVLVSKENPVFDEWLKKWFGEEMSSSIIHL